MAVLRYLLLKIDLHALEPILIAVHVGVVALHINSAFRVGRLTCHQRVHVAFFVETIENELNPKSVSKAKSMHWMA
jgi:hypothetical protein